MIKKFNNKEEVNASEFKGLILALNNGDKTGLEDAMKRWNFKDEESFLKFVIAVMLKAEDQKLFIQVGGEQTTISPSDTLIKSSADN